MQRVNLVTLLTTAAYEGKGTIKGELDAETYRKLYENKLARHEITHVLEGTEFYDDFRRLMVQFAKTRGEYDSRMKDQPKDYGDKFYDIESIENQTNLSATYGAPFTGTSPHQIKTADSSSDKLTVTQKQRVVNRGSATYSAGDSGASTAMTEAFRKAGIRNSLSRTDEQYVPRGDFSIPGKAVKRQSGADIADTTHEPAAADRKAWPVPDGV